MSLVFSDWRLMARLMSACAILLAVFLFGVWLTQPSFPINRKFAAISLNGDSLLSLPARKPPMFEVVRQSLFAYRAEGFDGCNYWGRDLVLTGTRWIMYRGNFVTTALGCSGLEELPEKYLRAVLGANRWRREGGILILENDSNVLRLYPTYR